MKRKILWILCTCLFCVGNICAQEKSYMAHAEKEASKTTNKPKKIGMKSENPGNNYGLSIGKKSIQRAFKASDRLAGIPRSCELYAHVSKRYGWYKGIGKKLTKKQACGLPFYYRLSGKDKHGHFTRIEALDSAGRLTRNHDAHNHLSHSVTDSVTQWLLDGDAEGKLLQESGYTADRSLVYTCHFSLLTNGDIIVYYTNGYGEPIDLQNDGSSDKYVQMKLDSVGRESVVYFLGDNLHIQRNQDEASSYGVKYIYGYGDSIVRKEYLDYKGEAFFLYSASPDLGIGAEAERPADTASDSFRSSPDMGGRDKTEEGQVTNDTTMRFGRDLLGHHARTHREKFFYYQARQGYTYLGDTAYMIGFNEYGEPSYITGSEYSGAKIYCKGIYGGNGIFYDENGEEIIDDMKVFRSTLGKAYFVEVLTQQAYEAGLRSGDMIVRYAGFYYPTVQTDFWKYSNELQAQIYMSRNKEKDIYVLRYDSKMNAHAIQRVHLPTGTAGQIGFQFIMGCLTKRETARYNEAVRRYLKENDKEEISDGMDYSICLVRKPLSIVRPYKIDATEMPTWQDGLREDVIVVAAQVIDSIGHITQTYTISQNGCVLDNLKYDKEEEKLIIYYTTDGKKLQSIRLRDAIFYTTYEFPKDEYENILRLEEQLPPSVFRKEENRKPQN